MHTKTRPWHLPAGLALAGGIFLGIGAMIAVPLARSAPSPVDVGDPHARAFPSYPDEVPSVVGVNRAPVPLQPIAPRPPLPVPEGVAMGPESAPDDGVSNAPQRNDRWDGPAPRTYRSGSGYGVSVIEGPRGVGGGPPPAPAAAPSPSPAAPAPAAAPSPSPAAPVQEAPVFGAPPPQTPSGPPIVSGAPDRDPILYTGPSGGTQNPGIVDPALDVPTSLLVPLEATPSPESTWPALAPFVRGGDVVVARAHDASSASRLLDWGARVRIDRPLVTYVVAFDDPAQLRATIDRGLPAGIGALGITRGDLAEEILRDLSRRVRESGRSFFVSTTASAASATIGAVADLVEIDPQTADPKAVADATRTASITLASGGRPRLWIRVPEGSLRDAQQTTAPIGRAVDAAAKGAGLAVPWSTGLDRTLSSFRAAPPTP
jgi:hypothetical protein